MQGRMARSRKGWSDPCASRAADSPHSTNVATSNASSSSTGSPLPPSPPDAEKSVPSAEKSVESIEKSPKGAIGQFGPQWLIIAATITFGAVHSAFASRLLAGRNRTGMLQVSAEVAGNRVALIVIGMLLTFVAMQVLAVVALDADGAGHSQLWAAGMVALTLNFGGPEILRTLLRLGRS